ncbi:MFS transporter [Acinetobacter courvalinii]|uniref:MFS transporter n=1 Tax=Acinetobacter courvalinii TaxID=280147 RepID=UPI0021D31D8B|nr:MFS transporter [Acinetobacter courvalinii]MCU4367397.1 MFS transporter [Acinetobacter courvalinii]MCU4445603.1 MFS transporter [Acinetobacter courvalinii]
MKQQTEFLMPTADTIASPERLPLLQLLALTLASFLATANETIPAGLLDQIATGFVTSEAWAGQTVTLCALGAGIAGIPLTVLTKKYPQRNLLLISLITFSVCNLLTALSTHFIFVLCLRFIIGLATGLAWSILATYARSMAPPHLQGRALAIAMLGIPLALALGVPLSAWLSVFIGWRNIFIILSMTALLLTVWVFIKVPNYHKNTSQRSVALKTVFTMPGVRPILFLVMAWILSHYLLYTYITPLLTDLGLKTQIDFILLVFGLSTLLGIWLIGLLVDQHLKKLIFISLTTFLIISVLLSLSFNHLGLMLFTVFTVIWGLSFSGAPTLLQTVLANAARENADIAQSLLVTVFNLSFACSGIIGGILLETLGTHYFPFLITFILAVALEVLFIYKKIIF